jgi:hypothetical protein
VLVKLITKSESQLSLACAVAGSVYESPQAKKRASGTNVNTGAVLSTTVIV